MNTPTVSPAFVPYKIDNSYSKGQMAGLIIEVIVAFIILLYAFFLILLYRDGKNWKEAAKQIFSTLILNSNKRRYKKYDYNIEDNNSINNDEEKNKKEYDEIDAFNNDLDLDFDDINNNYINIQE